MKILPCSSGYVNASRPFAAMFKHSGFSLITEGVQCSKVLRERW